MEVGDAGCSFAFSPTSFPIFPMGADGDIGFLQFLQFLHFLQILYKFLQGPHWLRLYRLGFT
jgi:hypothetical protein